MRSARAERLKCTWEECDETLRFMNENLGLPRSNGQKEDTITRNRALFAYFFTLNGSFLTISTYWERVNKAYYHNRELVQILLAKCRVFQFNALSWEIQENRMGLNDIKSSQLAFCQLFSIDCQTVLLVNCRLIKSTVQCVHGKAFFQWCPDQSDRPNGAWDTCMHKNAQKFEWKTQSKISCHYTWLLHGKNCPSQWCFLRSFSTASRPSRRSITAAKMKEKEKRKSGKIKSKSLKM